jgi:endonuclease G
MAAKSAALQVRADVVATDNKALSKAMADALRETPSLRAPAKARAVPKVDAERLKVRTDLIESPDADPAGFERILGESDLTSINYLDRGRRAAAAVCRIRSPSLGGEWSGTAFLVGPRLLMTNHHVLGNRNEASQAEAEFGYEHDVDGVLKRPDSFNLSPHEVFFTDPDLDVTFVSVAPLSDLGVPLERYGRLPLLPLSGKGIDKEWVTIIQHPGGGPKQISIRSSRIVSLAGKGIRGLDPERFIHYLTDTEPGSSGAPVVNDQWQVVALHHKAVPAPPDPARPDAEPVWVGNEGVRISAIYKALERCRFSDENAARVLERLEAALGLTPAPAPAAGEAAFEKDGKPYKPVRWTQPGVGYNPNFLSEQIDLAPIYAGELARGNVAPLLNGTDHELDYNHFSVVVQAKRKFALLTAVNIEGGKLIHPGERSSSWRRDARMDEAFQPAGEFYEKDLGTDKIQFSRGHMVRRLDPAWGAALPDAKAGDQDTFHYTNAAPQFQKYNDVDWGNLEDYVLDRAQTLEKRITVFQGPIFLDDDPLYGASRVGGPWRIPLSFWKIAVLQKPGGVIAAAAFINGQVQYVQALYETKVFTNLTPYTVEQLRTRNIQTTIVAVEAATGLDFSVLRPFDAHGSLEATRRTRWIDGPEDIQI